MKEDLTKKQKRVFLFIERFIDKKGYPPTRQEIADRFNYSSVNSAVDNVKALKRKGWIHVDAGIGRGIRIL